MAKLTPTSYVILGLLSLRSWSTYELAQQMRRSIHYYWPRAESHVYEEPKKLVAAGFATATRERVGRRPRTVYAITPAGRAELRRWVEQPGALPTLEFEGLLKVLFAEQADKRHLLANLSDLRAQAEEARRHHAGLATNLAETGGPFPGRLHVNALVFRFMWDHAEMLIRWIDWVEDEVAGWPDDLSSAGDGDPAAILRAATQR